MANIKILDKTMNTEYINSIAKELLFPTEALESVAWSANIIQETCPELFDEALWAFEYNGYSMDGMKTRFLHIGELTGLHEYTVALLFLLAACEGLEKRYSEAGYDRALFLDTMSDIRYKLYECKTVKGVWGNFVYWWYQRFYDMTRFALGRFQYEKIEFPRDIYGVGGHYVKRGDAVLNFHIPSSGVHLTNEVRFDSYKRAKEFFFPNTDAPALFVCDSWLLWHEYEEFIPENMNLKKFRRDFAIISSSPSEGFGVAWRVFGADAGKPTSELPRKTGQQRMFADYMASGGGHGSAFGVFFFDGEKIIK